MKKIGLVFVLTMLMMTQGVLAQMIVTSDGIKSGIIEDKYGSRGTTFTQGMPNYSLPLKITGAPANTKSYAIVLQDKDAIPPAGFSWIHWVVADLTRPEIKENESISATDFVQGTNSWSSGLLGTPLDRMTAAGYGGMAPPDKPHVYDITVYALDTKIGLKKGFYLNELYKAMKGHILEEVTVLGTYNN